MNRSASMLSSFESTENSFFVHEELSYDMIATYICTQYEDRNDYYDDTDAYKRMYESLKYSVNPCLRIIRCFPKWKFGE
jgi:hypothetical protein